MSITGSSELEPKAPRVHYPADTHSEVSYSTLSRGSSSSSNSTLSEPRPKVEAEKKPSASKGFFQTVWEGVCSIAEMAIWIVTCQCWK